MSLRTEIREAIDEVTPAAPTLEWRVEAFVEAHPRRGVVRRSRDWGRWRASLRGSMALVAAALVVALMAGLIAGVRLWRDASTVNSHHINQTQLKQLEAKPLQFPVVQPAAPCPTSPLTDASAHGPVPLLIGVGPVYVAPLGNNLTTSSWGTWIELALVVDTTAVSGPILVRARDVNTNQVVVFAQYPFHPSDQAGDGIPVGRVLRTDVILGVAEQVYPEMVLDTSRPFVGTKRGDWPIFKGYMGYPKTSSGCFGLQVDGFHVDGTRFTELLVVE